MGSNALIQRISVLFPEPLGPQTTATSPYLMDRLISFRTCREPNHLLTPRNSIMKSLLLEPCPINIMRVKFKCQANLLRRLCRAEEDSDRGALQKIRGD